MACAKSLGLSIALLLLGPLLSAPAMAATPLTKVQVASGLSNPLFVTAAPGDTGRIFVLEQKFEDVYWTGRVRIVHIPGYTLNAAPFLSISPVTGDSEQGLLGMAFDPNYADNGYFYVSYTTNCTDPPGLPGCGSGAGQSVIARYTVSSKVPDYVNPSPDVADPASRAIILQINQPQSNHNGGCLNFGPDGMLYFGLGDGGDAGDPWGTIGNGQDLTTYMGKMLRLDLSNPPTYIPSDNPSLYGTPVDLKWQTGLRNPWRFSFDRANGDLYIGDVGQNRYEEIDYVAAGTGAGRNFGWRCREGNATYNCNAGPYCLCPGDPGLTPPIYAYFRGDGTCVIGGYVYRGPRIPDLQGTYFFGDYGYGRIWSFNASGGTYTNFIDRSATLGSGNITSFGEDAEGEIYMCSRSGSVQKIVVNCAGSSLGISPNPASQTACQGRLVVFAVGVGGSRGATSFTWRRNGSPIGAPSLSTLTLSNVGPGDAGNYDVVVQDQCNSTTSAAATLTVNVVGPGDIDADCAVNLNDVPLFVDVLLDLDIDPGHVARADVNGDTFVDALDIDPFTHLVAP